MSRLSTDYPLAFITISETTFPSQIAVSQPLVKALLPTLSELEPRQ